MQHGHRTANLNTRLHRLKNVHITVFSTIQQVQKERHTNKNCKHTDVVRVLKLVHEELKNSINLIQMRYKEQKANEEAI